MKPLPTGIRGLFQQAFVCPLYHAFSFCFFRLRCLMGLLLFLLAFSEAYAQTAIQWDKDLGGSRDDQLASLQQTAEGGYVVGGTSDSPVSGHKTEISRGQVDYWIVRLDADRNKIWDKTLGGSGADRLKVVRQTADGGYILGGTSDSPLSGDKTGVPRGGLDFWVVRLNAAGNKVWDKTLGGSGSDQLNALLPTADGGYILGGTSDSPAGGDKTSTAKGGFDFWLIKLDAAGNKQWDKTYGGNSLDDLKALQQVSDGGFILGGSSDSGIMEDKTQESRGLDFWMLRVDAQGNRLWDKTIGGDGRDELRSVLTTADGGFILGGRSDSPLSGHKSDVLGCGTNELAGFDLWVVKLDAARNKEWDRTFGNCEDIEEEVDIFRDHFTGVLQTPDGGFLIGGYFNSAFKGSCAQSSCYYDFWLFKVHAAGHLEWEKIIGGRFSDLLADMQPARDGGFILGGYSNSAVSGDKTENNIEVCAEDEDEQVTCKNDFWLVKLTPFSSQIQVLSFELINANNERAIRIIQQGAVIDLAGLPSRNLNIRANVYPAVVGSVRFQLSGAARRHKWDNSVPYALFGDNNGNYYKWVTHPGDYTLTATPYSGADAQGLAGTPLTIHFRVIDRPSEVSGFILVNATNGHFIRNLRSGDEVNLALLPSRRVNIRANTIPSNVGSVHFELSGPVTRNKSDNEQPFALFGDYQGRYTPWKPLPGDYTLRATPYTASNAQGTAGTPLAIRFRVIDRPARQEMAHTQAAGDLLALHQASRLYPNPTPDGRVQVQMAGGVQGPVRYRLESALGKELTAGTIYLSHPASVLEFDFSGQIRAAGLYFLRLEGSRMNQVLKILRR